MYKRQTPSGTERFQQALSIYKGGKGSVRFPLDQPIPYGPVSYTHLRAHETVLDLVCRLLLEQKKDNTNKKQTLLTL